MTIAEPMTALTDWILGGIALVCAARLRVSPPQRSVARWRWGFVATAVASICGGLYHALAQGVVLWKTSTIAVGVASFFMLAASATSRLEIRGARLLTGLAALQLAAYTLWMVGHDQFLWVIVNYGAAMIAVAVVHAATYRRDPAPARWILGGIAIAASGAAVQALGISPHPRFNNNDLFHVIR